MALVKIIPTRAKNLRQPFFRLSGVIEDGAGVGLARDLVVYPTRTDDPAVFTGRSSSDGTFSLVVSGRTTDTWRVISVGDEASAENDTVMARITGIDAGYVSG